MFAGLLQRVKEGWQMLAAVLGRLGACDDSDALKTPVFTVGCQRSGTTMLIRVLSICPQIQVFGEASKEAYSEGVRIRSKPVLRGLICNSPQPIVVFKPLNDTQNVDRLLAIHPNAKAIWAYRHFHDVVNSLVDKWGDVQIEAVRQIATGSYTGPGARALGERLSPENLLLARKLNEKGLSANDAAAFIWYLRNGIYFDLDLAASPYVLLCKYEDLVTDPEQYFQRIFAFIGGQFSTSYIAKVRSSSINKSNAPELGAEISALCEELMERIDRQYQLQLEMEQAAVTASAGTA